MGDNSLIVLIDGPRGSGKSTIAKAVVERLESDGMSAAYFKKGKRAETEDDIYGESVNMVKHLSNFYNMEEDIIVVDRFLLTEWVMSIWEKRIESRALFLICNEVNKIMLNLNVLHYCITAPVDVLSFRIKQRETRGWDMPPDVVTPLWDAANSIFGGVSVLLNAYTKDLQENIDSIVDDINKRIGEQHGK